MTLAKITVSGTVVKNPEKRFTQNNLAITSFVMDVNPQDETLVRVFALGNLADRAADILKMGDTVLVDGRLQTANAKTTNGKERKIIEINASSVDKISILSESGNYSGFSQAAPAQNTAQSAPQSAPMAQAPAQKEIVQFAVDEISEDLIDEDEIPF